jgi:hypothetical protein
MKKFVFWTGIYNIVGGISFLGPKAPGFSLIKFPESNFWVWTLGAAIAYLGLALVLCSRDLAARASLVYWDGILRVVGFFLFAGFGFLGGLGVVLGMIGIVDLLVGVVYLIGLPKALNTSIANLLLDRAAKKSI